MEMTGKEALCKILEAEGITHVFGNPGSTEVPFLDALISHPNIHYVLALHESEAVAMADGYARASGRPAVVNVHAAPGTANTLGNLYNAYIDHIPLIVIAGQQDSRMLVRQPFLSADLVRMTSQFTKWSWQVSRIEELAITLRRAFKEATSAPTGPVFLALSKNVLDEIADIDIIPPSKYRVPGQLRGDANGIQTAAELLVSSEGPVVIAGEGVGQAGAMSELVELAELLGARVYSDPNAFPTGHDQWIGPIERQINLAKGLGDTVLAVGIKLWPDFVYSPNLMFSKETRIVHLDSNPWEIAKNYPVDAGIVADVKIGLRELTDKVKGLLNVNRMQLAENRLVEVRREKENIRTKLENELRAAWDAVPTRGPRLIREMRDILPKDAIIMDQSIRTTGYLKRYYDFSLPGTYHIEKGGCLGWGIGAAVGAQLAQPNRQVVALVGDGATNFGCKALWTAARNNIPAIIIVINNGGYMAVKSLTLTYKGEAAKQGRFIGADIQGVDYVRLAESYGVRGWRVAKPDEIRPALEQALESRKPALLEVIMDPKDAGFGMPRLP